ncbi:MAG: protein TolQ [Oligoflexia bacterium]|nr:protein TolQ [Oligoflexia bacterium]
MKVVKTDAWDLILHAGPVVKLVLLILILFSIYSWAIILTKKLQLTKISLMNSRFLEQFWQAPNLDSVFLDIDRYSGSTLASVFKAGYMELQKIADDKASGASGTGGGVENIQRALTKAADSEVSSMEGRTAFLATVASTGPFIGLFGTVWGIMAAFQNIGATGAASLATVAPGISEALIATAIGLAAAIPAAVGYNYFVGKFKKQDLEINNFVSDFLNLIKRNFFRD